MQEFSTAVWVVAAALIDGAGRVLMQKRRAGNAHGGLWEFPGGKIEAGETPENALIREIEEELAIVIDPCELAPFLFSSDPRDEANRVVILLYTCMQWRGEPQSLDAEEFGWFHPDALGMLDMPPLDIPLAAALGSALENSGGGLPSPGIAPMCPLTARP